MRILYFTRDYTPHDHRFLSSLAQSEHEVYYLRLERSHTQLEDRPLPTNVNIVRWAGGRSPAKLSNSLHLFLSLRKVLRQIKPDVLHAGPIHTVALLAALSGFQPLVSMSWGSDLLRDANKNRIYRWVTRLVLNRSTVLIGDCDAVRAKAIAFGFPNARIVTFPWGINLQNFTPGDDGELRKRAGWEGNFVLLHTRSWEEIYGVEVLARAFISAATQKPELRLFMLGGGSLAAKLRGMFERAGVSDKISFPGQIPYQDLPSYYRAADIYVSASHSDGSSVSLMEALASGLPALVSDIPGNREWVIPQKNGDYFLDGDAVSLTQVILGFVENRDKITKQGASARKLAERRADWTENFPILLKSYEMALEKAH